MVLRFFEEFRLLKASPKQAPRGQGVFSSLMRKNQKLFLILTFSFSTHTHTPKKENQQIISGRLISVQTQVVVEDVFFLSKVQSKNYPCKQGIWKEMKKKWMRILLQLLLLSEFQFELDSDRDWRQACHQQDNCSSLRTTANELPFVCPGSSSKASLLTPTWRLSLLQAGWICLLFLLKINL